jgi:hypothetical protein
MNQKEIESPRINKATVWLMHYKGQIGIVVWFQAGKYTASHHNVRTFLSGMKPHAAADDYTDIKRNLKHGCPASINHDTS